MTAKQHFFLHFFLIIAVPTFAQITKGSKSISSANLSYQSFAQTATSVSNSPFETNNYSMNLFVNSPFYMVTNRLQMGLGLGFYFQKNDNYDGSSQPKAYYAKTLTLSPDVTYYFTKNSRGFYANIGGEYNPFEFKTVNKQTSNTESSNSDYFYRAHIGLGYLKPINDNVFFNYLLNYERSNIVNSVGLSAGFSNIVPSIFGKKTDETPQFVEAGRSIISGSLAAKYFDSSDGILNIYGYFERLKFKNNHFALGYYGGASVVILPNRDDSYSFSGGTKARYYIPMSKRWYIYPEIGLGLSFSKDNINTNIDLVLDKGVGVNYFVTKNVALDVNVAFGVRSNKTENSQQLNKISNTNGSINFGVTYFIDKLF
jgi:outer membrane protein W